MSIQSERIRQYSRWCFGNDPIPVPNPKVLGELLDAVADRLEWLEQEIENLGKQKGQLRARILDLEEALIEETGTVEELEAFRAANRLPDD